MNRFPRRADAFEHERHAARRGFRSALVVLRLRPKTSHNGSACSQHRYRNFAHVEFYILDFRVRTLTVLSHLVPALRDGAVVVEQTQTPIVPVSSHNAIDVRVTDPIE